MTLLSKLILNELEILIFVVLTSEQNSFNDFINIIINVYIINLKLLKIINNHYLMLQRNSTIILDAFNAKSLTLSNDVQNFDMKEYDSLIERLKEIDQDLAIPYLEKRS